VAAGPTYRGPEERAELGKEARRACPRSSHAELPGEEGRFDPVALVRAEDATRIQSLVPLRRERMSASAFTFFRGSAVLMAADLAGTPTTGLDVQLCGDAHLSNFGGFGTPERRLLFDINDFDETHPGPWEWDVKRLVTSFVVAGRDNGFSSEDQQHVAQDVARGYREAMRRFAEQPTLTVWYSGADVDAIEEQYAASTKARKRLRRASRKARTRDSVQVAGKLTEPWEGQRRFVADPPTLVPARDLAADLEHQEIEARVGGVLDRYRSTLVSDRRHLLDQFRFVDLARVVRGVGSVGTRGWLVLLMGRDRDEPLLLQVKEAQQSVLARYLPGPPAGDRPAHQGERVVSGQRLMQAASDLFLGWDRVTEPDGNERDYYVRQFRDWKFSARIETQDPDLMSSYGRLCGWTLARAHARSGDRIAIASYLGKGPAFDQAVVAFAVAYADRNESDYRRFLAAPAPPPAREAAALTPAG
jgi:uncharacterized protein (DUF2252 family)